MSCYADTSFLASLYLTDQHSVSAATTMKRAQLPFLLTAFGRFELTNALSLRLFRKELSESQWRTALTLVEDDIAGGVLLNSGMPAAIFDQAEGIARKQTPMIGTRTLDVLHVASALALRATAFYTFDRRQAALAAVEGLRIL